MRLMSSFLRTLLVVAPVATVACSYSPTAPTEPVTIVLAPGQTQVVGRMSIRFVGITADSRCPADANCVHAGDVSAALETTLAGQRSAFELRLFDTSGRSRAIRDYRVELREVVPYPFASLPPINAADYRVSLTISAN